MKSHPYHEIERRYPLLIDAMKWAAILSTTEAEELTARMRTPKADVSAKAGRMERESPLFFGTGENPILF
jgi:hypothetical protein